MEQLIEKIIRTPWPTKIAALAGAVLAVVGGVYLLGVSPAADEIETTDRRLRELDGEYLEKQQIANNLNQYRKEKELLDQRLQEALTELPNEAAIDELLRQLNDLGAKSGLEIVAVEPGAEVPDQFFARIPIKMKVVGNYHEVAVFFDSVGKLKRIVNVNDVSLKTPAKRAEKIVVNAEYVATTFRFLPKPEAGAKGAKK
jgi:type IV pilus assembly protein PilO